MHPSDRRLPRLPLTFSHEIQLTFHFMSFLSLLPLVSDHRSGHSLPPSFRDNLLKKFSVCAFERKDFRRKKWPKRDHQSPTGDSEHHQSKSSAATAGDKRSVAGQESSALPSPALCFESKIQEQKREAGSRAPEMSCCEQKGIKWRETAEDSLWTKCVGISDAGDERLQQRNHRNRNPRVRAPFDD